MDINLDAVFWCCRAFGKQMLATGKGSIVNIGSISGFIVNKPQPQAFYNASKAAVHHLTRSLAAELRSISASTLALTTTLNQTLTRTQPDLEATLASARVASDKLAKAAEGLERALNANEGGLGRAAGASVAELQQLVVDARVASNEVRELARVLRERPSSVLFEPKATGVEIPR